MEIYIASMISVIITASVCLLIAKHKQADKIKELGDYEIKARELEREIHICEARHLQSKNNAELQFHEDLKNSRVKHFKEGYSAGISAGQKDHQIEITNLQSEHRNQLAKERSESEEQGKRLARAEFESQTKAFSVRICPYVFVEDNNGIFKKESKSKVGYQYQLLVNGIPAFQPHLVIEKTENISNINQETIDKLIEAAGKMAEQAINTYLNGVQGSALKHGQAIVVDHSTKILNKQKEDVRG